MSKSNPSPLKKALALLLVLCAAESLPAPFSALADAAMTVPLSPAAIPTQEPPW